MMAVMGFIPRCTHAHALLSVSRTYVGTGKKSAHTHTYGMHMQFSTEYTIFFLFMLSVCLSYMICDELSDAAHSQQLAKYDTFFHAPLSLSLPLFLSLFTLAGINSNYTCFSCTQVHRWTDGRTDGRTDGHTPSSRRCVRTNQDTYGFIYKYTHTHVGEGK